MSKKEGKNDKSIDKSKKKGGKKEEKKKITIVEAATKEKFEEGIVILKKPLEEKEVLFNVKIILVGDPCTLDDRRRLMWGYCKSHGEMPSANLQTTQKDVKIDGFAGRVSTILYDNNVSRSTSYFPFNGVHGVLLVYRADDPMSFRHVYNWLSEARRYCNNENVFAYVIGIYNDKESTDNLSRQDQAIVHLMKMKMLMYYPGNETEFDNFLDNMVVNIRRLAFNNDKLDLQHQKKLFESGNFKVNKKGYVPIQSQLESQQRKLAEKDPYRRLISQEVDRGLTYTLRMVFCGDDCCVPIYRKIANGIFYGWDAKVKAAASLENLATAYREIENKSFKIKAVGYDPSAKRGMAYTPFSNALAAVMCFDYTNKESFNHLTTWEKESKKGSLDEMKVFIIGMNADSGKKEVTDKQVQDYLATFPTHRKPTFAVWDESKKEEFENEFKNWVNSIRRRVFRKKYIEAVEKEIVAKERLGAVQSQDEATKLGPISYPEDPQNDGCVIQ